MLILLARAEAHATLAAYATTKLSSKGQVVIPEDVRNDLGLNEGDQFVVIGQGDAVILKVITPPKLEEFQKLLSRARTEAKRLGIKKADVKSAIAKVRRRAK
jgi:AbrB family looped-hinge helix DNA binding protein